MGSSDKTQRQDVQARSEQYQAKQDTRYNNFNSTLETERLAQRLRADEERKFLTDAYRGVYGGSADRDYLRSVTGGPPFGAASGGTSGGSSSGGGDEGYDGEVESSGGGGGTASGPPAPPPDPFADSWGGFSRFAGDGGVDIGKLEESLGGFRDFSRTGGITDARRKSLDDTLSGYKSLSDNPIAAERLSNINNSLASLRGFTDTGGYDPLAKARIEGDIAKMRGFGDTGAVDTNQLAALRGNINNLSNFRADFSNVAPDIARYREFADTGGYSSGDIQNIRQRATSVIPALYSQERDELARRQNVAGGGMVGVSAAQRQLARDQAQRFSGAALNAETDIADRVRTNRLTGIEGLAKYGLSMADIDTRARLDALTQGTKLGSDLEFGVADRRLSATRDAGEAEGRLAGDIAANRLRAGESAADRETALAKLENDTRLSALTGQRETTLGELSTANQAQLEALKGITDTNRGAQSLVQQGRQFGVQGQFGVEQARQAIAQANAERAAANSRAAGAASASNYAADRAYDMQRASLASTNERFLQGQQFAALQGLTNLYGMGPGEVGQGDQTYLGSLGQQDRMNLGSYGVQMPQSQNGGQSWWQTALGAVGPVARAFGGGGNPGSGSGGDGYNYNDDRSYDDPQGGFGGASDPWLSGDYSRNTPGLDPSIGIPVPNPYWPT
jgi:hypothetical protein